MKKLSKILAIVVIATILSAIGLSAFATIDPADIKPDSTRENAYDDTILGIGKDILTIITNVGMIMAIVIIAVLGIRYMMGSTSDKSEYKKSMMPYLVGAILVFGASAIGRGIIGFGQSIAKSVDSKTQSSSQTE